LNATYHVVQNIYQLLLIERCFDDFEKRSRTLARTYIQCVGLAVAFCMLIILRRSSITRRSRRPHETLDMRHSISRPVYHQDLHTQNNKLLRLEWFPPPPPQKKIGYTPIFGFASVSRTEAKLLKISRRYWYRFVVLLRLYRNLKTVIDYRATLKATRCPKRSHSVRFSGYSAETAEWIELAFETLATWY